MMIVVVGVGVWLLMHNLVLLLLNWFEVTRAYMLILNVRKVLDCLFLTNESLIVQILFFVQLNFIRILVQSRIIVEFNSLAD